MSCLWDDGGYSLQQDIALWVVTVVSFVNVDDSDLLRLSRRRIR